MQPPVLHIFIKNARLGHVKTRLARTLGDEAALAIYQTLLEKTRAATQRLGVEKWVWYSEAIVPDDAWAQGGYRQMLQPAGDLGQRMEYAFARAFAEGAPAVAIIGSDCPELTADLLDEAFRTLAQQDAVLGPTPDGGYYLLGLRRMVTEAFRHIAWSTETVLSSTLVALQRRGCSVRQLAQRSDIDTEADWEAYQQRLASSSPF